MRHNERIEKPSRVYHVFQYDGLVYVSFQPRNPKTGVPWQASRYVLLGNVVHELRNTNSGESVIRDGLSPRNSEMWENGKWNSCSQGYRTVEDARAAVELYEAQRS